MFPLLQWLRENITIVYIYIKVSGVEANLFQLHLKYIGGRGRKDTNYCGLQFRVIFPIAHVPVISFPR